MQLVRRIVQSFRRTISNFGKMTGSSCTFGGHSEAWPAAPIRWLGIWDLSEAVYKRYYIHQFNDRKFKSNLYTIVTISSWTGIRTGFLWVYYGLPWQWPAHPIRSLDPHELLVAKHHNVQHHLFKHWHFIPWVLWTSTVNQSIYTILQPYSLRQWVLKAVVGKWPILDWTEEFNSVEMWCSLVSSLTNLYVMHQIGVQNRYSCVHNVSDT